MKKILSLVGPTATGKTGMALEVAEWLISTGKVAGVDLLSADSRQVYQGLEIVSGADVPEGFEWSEGYFEKNAIGIYGISMLAPDQDWSVGQFQDWAQGIIQTSWQQQRFPIVVGGTGLYHGQLWQPDPRLQMPPNLEVRQRAEQLSVEELQNWLEELDATTWNEMNDSDRMNPRRLVRKIELSLAEQAWNEKDDQQKVAVSTQNRVINEAGNGAEKEITVGLTDEIATIETKIRERVQQRFNAGATQEVERLLSRYPDQKLPIFTATGVKPLLAYLNDQITQEECLELWWRQERQYAKRQLTWWKKRAGVQWFAVSSPQWQAEVLHYVQAALEL